MTSGQIIDASEHGLTIPGQTPHPPIPGSSSPVVNRGAERTSVATRAGLHDWVVAHDFAYEFGGAERVTSCLSQSLPGSPVILLAGSPRVVDRMKLDGPLERVLAGVVNKRTYRIGAPLYPSILSRRDPVEGNLLASSYGFCHMLPCTGKKIVYCHSPLRQFWSGLEEYTADKSRATTRLWTTAAKRFQAVDRATATTVSRFIATSRAVRSRIQDYYGADDIPIIPPPIDERLFYVRPDTLKQDFVLWAGRIVEPYKRLELVLEAFRRRPDRRLVVAGDGRDRQRLEALAPPNVQFLGGVDGQQLSHLYSTAQALVFPSTDDFGMTAAEAIRCGTPVVAYAEGGALDTVVHEASGYFFSELSTDALNDALDCTLGRPWDPDEVYASRTSLDQAEFVEAIREQLAEISSM